MTQNHRAKRRLSQSFYEIATSPTSNEAMSEGSWLVSITQRQRGTHFFADGHDLSICGQRFAGPGVVPVEDPRTTPGTTSSGCPACTRILTLSESVSHLSTQQIIKLSEKSLPLVLEKDVYSLTEFQAFTSGDRWIAMRVNSMKSIDRDLHLMVDAGLTPSRHIRRALAKNLQKTDEVVLVWADEPPAPSEGAKMLDQLYRQLAREAARAADVFDLADTTSDMEDMATVSLKQWNGARWRGPIFDPDLLSDDLTIHAYVPGHRLSLCGEVIGDKGDCDYDIVKGRFTSSPVGSITIQDDDREVCRICWVLKALPGSRKQPTERQLATPFAALPTRPIEIRELSSAIQGEGFVDGFVTRLMLSEDKAMATLFSVNQPMPRLSLRRILQALPEEVRTVQVIAEAD